MRVKTIRRHKNDRPPCHVKNVGRKYEVSDHIGRNLIARGLVVEDEPGSESPPAPPADA